MFLSNAFSRLNSTILTFYGQSDFFVSNTIFYVVQFAAFILTTK